MKNKMKTIRKYIIYLVVVGIIFAFLSPIIKRYIGNGEFFDWQWFVLVIISGLFALLLKLYFPRFKKSGEI